MFKPKNENKTENKETKKKNTGFYIALGICMLTVAASAWTTYGSIADFNGMNEDVGEISEVSNVRVTKEVSGEKYEQSSTTEDTKEKSTPDKTKKSESSTVGESSLLPAETETKKSDEKYSPVEGFDITKKYSPEIPLKSKTMNDWRTHNGIDIKAPKGAAVRAITAGRVKSVYKDDMLGNMIVIEHKDFTAYYCGLSDSPATKEGDNVQPGDTVGYIGVVPSESLEESHLHLEVKKDGKYTDPIVTCSPMSTGTK